MPGFRVFVSYSRDEADKFQAVCAALKQVELDPWSDQDLTIECNDGFTSTIQNFISHSHLFVAIITPRSHKRGWVHQEIGFAVAMHVPVIPICVGQLPSGMIRMSQAIVVKDNFSDCLEKLKHEAFDVVVEAAGRRWLPCGECAHEVGERAELIEHYADEAYRRIGKQCVRHFGGLSSFRIPDEPTDQPIWKRHYGNFPKGEEIYAKLRRERQALARHADAAGCKLIINNGVDLDAESGGKGVWRSRLSSLVEYLETLKDKNVEIAIITESTPKAFLAVGNWFLAESAAVRSVRGIRHTLFMSYAPVIDQRIREFDHDLKMMLKNQERNQGCPPGKSRSWAIQVFKKCMDKLPDYLNYT